MNPSDPQKTPPGNDPATPPQQPPPERSGPGWSPTALIAVVGLIAVVIIVLLMFGLGGGSNSEAPAGGDVNVTQEAPAAPAADEPATPAPDEPETPAPAPENGSMTIEVTPPADSAQPETQE